MILSDSPKNILVTGAAGYIGTKLVARLCRSGYRVFGVDITEPTFVHKNFHFTVVDLLDDQARQRVFEGLVRSSDCRGKSFLLFHLAGISDAGKCAKDPEKCYAVNSLLAKDVVHGAVNVGIGHHVFLSSAHVYGLSSLAGLPETSAIRPISVYGQAKADAERKLKECFQKSEMTVDVVRLSNIYGDTFKEGTVMSDVYEQIKLRKDPVEVNDYRPVRDFIYIDDVIEGLLRIMQTQSGRKFDVINLGTGKGTSIGGLIAMMESVVRRETKEKMPQNQSPDPNADRLVLSIERLIARTAWRPSIDVWTGLEKMIRVS